MTEATTITISVADLQKLLKETIDPLQQQIKQLERAFAMSVNPNLVSNEELTVQQRLKKIAHTAQQELIALEQGNNLRTNPTIASTNPTPPTSEDKITYDTIVNYYQLKLVA